MTGVLKRRGKFGHRKTEGRIHFEDGGRNWSNVSTNQGKPRIACNHQKIGESRKYSSLETLEGSGP